MWLAHFILTVHLLLCGCWVIIVESQGTVSKQIAHGLVPRRLESLYGSDVDGSCTSVVGNHTFCNGTSVLNDGNIPVLSGVSDVNDSVWATQLFTLVRAVGGRLIIPFELKDSNHDRVELAVFNCPALKINAPSINVYLDTSFRAGRANRSDGTLNTNLVMQNTSCDQLLIFCVKYSGGMSSRYINLEFPFVSDAVSNLVFLGEVTFLNGSGEPCSPPRLVTEATTSATVGPTTAIATPVADTNSSNIIVVIVTVIVLALLILIISLMAVVVAILCVKVHRRKQESSRIQQLQNVVMETKSDEEKEAETFIDGLNNYECIDKPLAPPNGVREVENSSIMDVLYSQPDEVRNDTYSHLRDGEKSALTAWDPTAVGEQYSKLNRSQTDPVTMIRRSPTPKEGSIDEGIMYAMPDRSKKKKKGDDNSPAVPKKSRELVEYLDTKFSHSERMNGSDTNLPEYSEIGNGSSRRSGSVGPLPLSKSASKNFAKSLNSNPIYQPTDIVPGNTAGVQEPQYNNTTNGVLESDAIYSEPLPPNEHEQEWNADQNIYESIYSEPLKPSLFMQESYQMDAEDLRPYSSIYTAPVIDSGEKPLSVSISNIKEIKCLGDGNFGQVVLAQTVGLTPRDLQLEGEAPYTLVAVKKLKQNASERNKDLFDKEVKFMSRLNHPNVIRLLAVCTDEATPFIMMEYMKNGDLNQYLKRFHSIGDGTYDNVKPIDTATLVYMCTQIASAMQYLASQNFVHRDLATRNCLVGSKNTIKVSDFGMSRSLYESSYYIISGHAILPIRWMATECFYGKFSAKTDVWAFGVTMWEIFMLAKEQPYGPLSDQEIVEDAVKGPDRVLLERPTNCPEELYDIMRTCWAYEASQRPTFDDLYALLSNA